MTSESDDLIIKTPWEEDPADLDWKEGQKTVNQAMSEDARYAEESEDVYRMRAQLSSQGAFNALDEVVERHGVEEGKKWSFAGHEYQRQIIRDVSSRIYVKKCSQVGLSSSQVQKILALLSVLQHKRIIYTMPVVKEAYEFSRDRFDAAIENSPYYSSLMKNNKDSASLKQLGTSLLYIRGTMGGSSGISVPALVLVHDELDFSNQKVLTQYMSRLRHQEINADGSQGFRFGFSTPTAEGFGIDAQFLEGSQQYYTCKCKHCNSEVIPDFFNDFVVPGFDDDWNKFGASDYENPSVKLSEAKILCPKCHGNLFDSLCDPERRRWAAKFPDRRLSSYQVSPWDVPKYNTPELIISQFGDYKTHPDEFFNFVLGLARSTAENSFLVTQAHKQLVENKRLVPYIPGGQGLPKGSTVGGVDVGKKCHLVVLAPAPAGTGRDYDIIWAEEIPNDPVSADEEIRKRFEFYGMSRLFIDQRPDISLVTSLVAWGKGKIASVEYARSVEGLSQAKIKDDGRTVRADRSKSIRTIMTEHNAGRYGYAMELSDRIFAQLKAIRKQVRKDADNFNQAEIYESNGPDHWGHALNYARLAADTELLPAADTGVVGHYPLVTSVRTGGYAKMVDNSQPAKGVGSPLVAALMGKGKR